MTDVLVANGKVIDFDRPWQKKRKALRASGHTGCTSCFNCLRALGITPDRDADVNFRSDFMGKQKYATDNGQPTKKQDKSAAQRAMEASEERDVQDDLLRAAEELGIDLDGVGVAA